MFAISLSLRGIGDMREVIGERTRGGGMLRAAQIDVEGAGLRLEALGDFLVGECLLLGGEGRIGERLEAVAWVLNSGAAVATTMAPTSPAPITAPTAPAIMIFPDHVVPPSWIFA